MEASGQIHTLASVPREKSWVETFGDFRIILKVVLKVFNEVLNTFVDTILS